MLFVSFPRIDQYGEIKFLRRRKLRTANICNEWWTCAVPCSEKKNIIEVFLEFMKHCEAFCETAMVLKPLLSTVVISRSPSAELK